MIWADNLLLLSKSEKGLNSMLKQLKSYTEKNGITLSIKKTKVMIFDKSRCHMRRNFYLEQIETTRKYKYLGFMVNPSGEITTGLKDFIDRALKATMKLKHKLSDSFRKQPQITITLV